MSEKKTARAKPKPRGGTEQRQPEEAPAHVPVFPLPEIDGWDLEQID
jgi:hypothetical protein